MPSPQRLLALLADGRLHSGAALSRLLDSGPSAVRRSVERLRALGLEVRSVRGRGYRLARPFEPLRAEAVRAALDGSARDRVRRLDVLLEVDSTNRFLMEQAHAGAGGAGVCLAEAQTGGRGRRGRAWISPLCGSVYLSVAWRFDAPPDALQGLSLAAGVAVADAIADSGAVDVGLKWPNDLLLAGRKVGGLLMEVDAGENGSTRVVTGVGVNAGLGPAAGAAIDQPWTALDLAATGRNRFAAMLIASLVESFQRFRTAGIAGFRERWEARDVARGRAVELATPSGRIRGRALGIGERGMLRLEVDGEERTVASGELSLRVVP